MATVSKFRIDVNVHSLLMNSGSQGPEVPVSHGLSLPEPVYPQFSEKLSFFGSNLRATQNLARNIANEIKQARWDLG